jgi:hypothetical protein
MRSRSSAAGRAKRRAAEVVGDSPNEEPAEQPEESKPKATRSRAAKEPAAAETADMSQVDDEVSTATEEKQERKEAARRRTATADPSSLSMGDGYDRIVDTLFDLPDPHEEYLAVKQSLKLGTRASRADYGTLIDALDVSEDMAERAFALLVNAKVARDAYDIDARAIEAGMRDQANAALQAEKDAKTRSKAITDADVTAYMAAKFPDEWRDIEARRGKARRTVSYLEDLAKRAGERARDLRQMVARARDA